MNKSLFGILMLFALLISVSGASASLVSVDKPVYSSGCFGGCTSQGTNVDEHNINDGRYDDGDDRNWVSNTGTGAFIVIDLENTYNITSINILDEVSTSFYDREPSNIDIEYSLDNSTWFPLVIGLDFNDNTLTNYTTTNDTFTARYIKLNNVNGEGGTETRLAEMFIYGYSLVPYCNIQSNYSYCEDFDDNDASNWTAGTVSISNTDVIEGALSYRFEAQVPYNPSTLFPVNINGAEITNISLDYRYVSGGNLRFGICDSSSSCDASSKDNYMFITIGNNNYDYYSGGSGAWNNDEVKRVNVIINTTSGTFDFYLNDAYIGTQSLGSTSIDNDTFYVQYLNTNVIGIMDNLLITQQGISPSCTEDWVSNNLSCDGLISNFTIIYTDANTCGTYDTLPVDNGTITSCCVESWVSGFGSCTDGFKLKSYTDSNVCNTSFQLPVDNNTQVICIAGGGGGSRIVPQSVIQTVEDSTVSSSESTSALSKFFNRIWDWITGWFK